MRWLVRRVLDSLRKYYVDRPCVASFNIKACLSLGLGIVEVVPVAHVKSECKCQEMCYTLGMDFPILDLADDELATDWLLKHFDPPG